MAFTEQKIKSGINFKTPFKKSTHGGFVMNDITVDAVADDIKNLLKTNFGERLIHYDMGANLRGLIFENKGEDLKQKISDSIVSAVEKWLPFVTLSKIEVFDSVSNQSLGDNEVLVQLSFFVVSSGLESSTTIRISA